MPYITTLCLNGTLSCVDFMDGIMGDIPYIITLCLNGTLSYVDFMVVIMGEIPLPDKSTSYFCLPSCVRYEPEDPDMLASPLVLAFFVGAS